MNCNHGMACECTAEDIAHQALSEVRELRQELGALRAQMTALETELLRQRLERANEPRQ